MSWKKGSEQEETIWFHNKQTGHRLVVDTAGSAGSHWYVVLWPEYGTKTLGKFKTKAKAMAFAKSWMRRHPNG